MLVMDKMDVPKEPDGKMHIAMDRVKKQFADKRGYDHVSDFCTKNKWCPP
jgi:hypothetical protein